MGFVQDDYLCFLALNNPYLAAPGKGHFVKHKGKKTFRAANLLVNNTRL